MPTLNIKDIPEAKTVKLVDLSEDSINNIAEAVVRKIAVDTKPVKRGYWISHGSYFTCSVCGEEQYGIDTGRYYCQNCGAKMDETLCETCAYLDTDKDGNKVCWVESDVDYIFFINDHYITSCNNYEKMDEVKE